MKTKCYTPKVFKVEVLGKSFLVNALTRKGAIRDLSDALNELSVAEIATPADMYVAGLRSESILGIDRYTPESEPVQLPLGGVPEQA